MRKLFILALFLILGMGATKAQNINAISGTMYSSYGVTSLADTIVNTAVGYLVTPVIAGNWEEITFTFTVTEISGTTAGSVVLMGSIDGGVSYSAVVIEEASTVIAAKSPADLTTDQTFMFRVKGNPALKYKLQYTGVGTMSARLRLANYLARK